MTEKHPGGRPTKYDPSYTRLVYKYALLGATDADLARNFEVDEATINRWKIAHPEFCESLRKGKEIADSEVAERLFNRACGYEREETKVVGKGEAAKAVVVETHYPAETLAAMYWLNNRQPDRWRHRSEQKMLGKDGETIVPIINIGVGGGTQS